MNLTYKPSLFILFACTIAFSFWFITENTYDLGDSITHYAIAHYSWKHPYLLFDNWGKPFFTIVSSPFAQFGWKGITFFNTLIGVFTSFVLAQFVVLKKWNISPYLALLLFFIPNYPLSLNSGLTEPLYALITLTCIYLFAANRFLLAMILLSFLPFVRSEGFITLTVFAFYYLMHKKFKHLPFLLLGTLIISLLGYLITYNQLDWMFTKNPYTEDLGHNYGHGEWLDYFTKYYYMTGIPFTLLFWSASIYVMYQLIKKCRYSFIQFFQAEESLYLQVFFSYFIAHVIFWKFGIFNSFGMSRVLIAVLPTALLILLYLLKDFSLLLPKHKVVLLVLTMSTILFPFTSNKSAWSKADFAKDITVEKLEELKPKITEQMQHANQVLYTSIPILTLLEYDVYDTVRFTLFKNKTFKKYATDSSCYFLLDTWTTQVDYNANEALNHLSTYPLLIDEKISDNNFLKLYKSKK